MSNQLDSKRVAVCLIIDNNKILMGVRKNNKYICPAGHVKVGEKVYDGAKRELFEETGFYAKQIKLVNVEWNKKACRLLYLFIVEVDNSKIDKVGVKNDPDGEFKSIVWVNPIEVIDQLSIPIEHNIALKWWFANSRQQTI